MNSTIDIFEICARDGYFEQRVKMQLLGLGVYKSGEETGHGFRWGKTSPDNATVNFGSALTYPSTEPTRDGYVFSGWYIDSSASYLYNFGVDMLIPQTDNLTPATTYTLYAGWTKNACTVTFNTEGGSAIPARSVSNGTSISSSFVTPPTKVGYTFAGWYLDEAYATALNSYCVNGDITLYAKWN